MYLYIKNTKNSSKNRNYGRAVSLIIENEFIRMGQNIILSVEIIKFLSISS